MTSHSALLFWRQFVHNQTQIGAILPSSAALGKAATAWIARRSGPIRVLEAGPGTGSFTCELIPRLQPGDSLDLVELSSPLTAFLHARLQREGLLSCPGVDVRLINGNLLHFPLATRYDFIVFSLPLSNFSAAMVESLLTLMMEHLKPGGVFSYVKYAVLGELKRRLSIGAARADMDARQAVIASFAARYQVGRRLVLRNLPPAWVYYWQKPLATQEMTP